MAAPIGVKNGRLTVFHKHAAASSDSAPSNSEIIQGGLRRTLLPLGVALLQAAGVTHQDAFVLVLENDRTSVACMLGAMDLQCVCVLLSKSRIALLPHVLQQTRLSTVLTVEGDAVARSDHDKGSNSAVWTKETALQGGGVGMLTSGSVGEPKVVMCSWERMLLQGQSTHEQLFPTRSARIVCGTSVSHAYSINAVFTLFTSPHDEGSELCFVSDVRALYDLLSERCGKFTLLYGTPATYTRLLELPAKPMYADVPYSAGTRLTHELFQLTLQHSGLQLMQNYGSTETGDIAAWQLFGKTFKDEAKLMSDGDRIYVGNLWPGVRVQIESDGEVLVWTPWQSMGYVIDGGLYLCGGAPHRTADRGLSTVKSDTLTELWLEGRVRPPISLKIGARFQLFEPRKVEALLKTRDGVTDVLVLMQDQTARRTQLRVRVVASESSNLTAVILRDWVAAELAIPALMLEIELVEFLPCSPAGKLMYM
jgi:acyl-coenzyme A synthetase/AMP-(fatty) acid ligase